MLYLKKYEELFEQLSDNLIQHLPVICEMYGVALEHLDLFAAHPGIPAQMSLKEKYRLFKH